MILKYIDHIHSTSPRCRYCQYQIHCGTLSCNGVGEIVLSLEAQIVASGQILDGMGGHSKYGGCGGCKLCIVSKAHTFVLLIYTLNYSLFLRPLVMF